MAVVLPAMRARGSGHVVNITSIGGKLSVPHLMPCSSAKFAAVGFSEGLHAQPRKEFTWFSLAASLPITSMSAEAAARQIVRAIERGETELVLTWQAALAMRLHGVMPGLMTIRIPHDGPDDRFLFLSDVLPTAWQAVEYADIPVGGSVAVFGLGPIGQMSARIARHRGARVIGVTDGRGTDAVIDAVGIEAHGSPAAKAAQAATGLLPDALAGTMMMNFGVDHLAALLQAIDTVRRGGTLSIVGVYGGMADPLPMLKMFDKGIQVRMGQAHVHRWTDQLMPLVLDESDPLGVADLAMHHLPLAEAPRAYELFQRKQDDAIKGCALPLARMVIGEDPSASGVERRAVVLVDRQAIGNNTSEHIRTDGPVNEQEAAPVLITGTHSVWTSRWRNSQSVGNGHAAADLIQQIIRERKTAD